MTDLYDDALRPGKSPKGASGRLAFMEGKGAGHHTQWYDDQYRVSWDSDGDRISNVHWTNQALPHNHADRNRPPPEVQQDLLRLIRNYAEQKKAEAFATIENLRQSHHDDISRIASQGRVLRNRTGQYTESEARAAVDSHFDGERRKQIAHWAKFVSDIEGTLKSA